ncbi:LysE family translocator [Mycobacterium sp. NPDC051804]|uniref:LysE family translocator n=1 Tax=Mycobacterium sp. NPDC051804 TaxID=3364295 RepID=UPI0037B5B6A4
MSGSTIAVVAIGSFLGFLSAVLPMGPVTVLVVHRTLAGDPSGALRFGLGRVPAEMIYCALATFGTVALLERFPAVRTGIEVLAIVMFLAVGGWLLVARTGPPPSSADAAAPRRNKWGFTAGFIVGALNPQYLFSWSAIVAIAVSVAGVQPSMLDRVIFPFAAALGVTLGYVLLVRFIDRRKGQMEGPAVRRVLQGLGVLLIALAAWHVVQVVSQ